MNQSGVNVVFRDLLLGVIGILILVMYVYMLQVNPIQKKVDETSKPPGSVTVLISWPSGDTDVDLWVTGPGEPKPVGYSNKGGRLWNLLRDDLGTKPDFTNINMESSYARGTPAGEYAVNVHCFRCPVVPQVVQVEVMVVNPAGGRTIVGTVTVTLYKSGQEKTALRFKLDARGALVEGSVNSVYRPLRSATPQGVMQDTWP